MLFLLLQSGLCHDFHYKPQTGLFWGIFSSFPGVYNLIIKSLMLGWNSAARSWLDTKSDLTLRMLNCFLVGEGFGMLSMPRWGRWVFSSSKEGWSTLIWVIWRARYRGNPAGQCYIPTTMVTQRHLDYRLICLIPLIDNFTPHLHGCLMFDLFLSSSHWISSCMLSYKTPGLWSFTWCASLKSTLCPLLCILLSQAFDQSLFSEPSSERLSIPKRTT